MVRAYATRSAGFPGELSSVKWTDARKVAERLQEQGRASLALAEVGHQQPGEGHQPRPRLSRGDTRRQCRARRLAATGAGQPVPLLFDHLRLDLGEFPHLMTQRRGVLSQQLSATAPAGRRLQGDHVVALTRREERPLLPGVAGLTTRTA